ncbi:MAG: DUF3426 domain-containing protein [Polaromonas sp.]
MTSYPLRPMSLITRCPACSTMFKVVADQLKVAQGWVRCGQCGEVFDASLQLQPDALALAGDCGLDKAAAEAPQQAPQQPVAQCVPAALPESHRLAEAPLIADANDVKPPNPPDAEAADFQSAELEGQPPPEDALDASAEVSFVREARHHTFWKTARMRAWLAMSLGLLLALLALQWTVRQKDALAAHEPRLAPWLQALCRPLGCEVRPMRRIESLVIDNSSLSKTGADAYRLTFGFKNTGAVALEIPALEVTLTNSQDQPLVRRVVLPAQFGVAAVTLGAHSELTGALAISLKPSGDGAEGAAASKKVGLLPVTGYRILAFYP